MILEVKGNFLFFFLDYIVPVKDFTRQCDSSINMLTFNHNPSQLLLISEECFFCTNILSMSLNRLECVWALRVAMQVALLGGDSCKWPLILKAKLLTLVCREHSNYLKLLFKILSMTPSVSLLKAKFMLAYTIFTEVFPELMCLVPFFFLGFSVR